MSADKLNLTPYIIGLLKEGKDVSIHGLGTFSLKQLSAKVDYINKQIQPLQARVTFHYNPEIENDEKLISLISYHSNVDADASTEAIREYIEHTNQTLLEEKSVELEMLGKLSLNEDNSISFIDNGDNYHSHPNLPVIPANLIDRNEVSEAPKIAEPVQAAVIDNTSSTTIDNNFEPSNVVNENLNEEVNFDEVPLPATVNNIEEEKSTIPWTPIIIALIIGLLGMILFYWLKRQPKDIAKNIDVITSDVSQNPAMADSTAIYDTSTTNVETNANVQHEDDNDAENEEANQPISSEANASKIKSLNCKIVVGSYANNDNVRKAVKRVKKLGYTAFTEKVNGLTRVGAKVSCNTNESNRALNVLRKRIDGQAKLLEQ